MTRPAGDRLLAFTIFSSAAFAGGNLFIDLSMGAYWLSLSPAEFMANFFGQWMFFLLTIMPLVLMTLWGLVRSANRDADDPALSALWRRAIVCFVATLLVTVVIHVPLNLRLGAAAFRPADVAATSDLYNVLSVFGAVTPETADFTRTLWLLAHIPRILLAIAVPYLAMSAAVPARRPGRVQ